MSEIKKYEWAVIGSGIAGTIVSEILTRQGHSVILIEKNEKLASETTRDFHEWMHAGSLYTLIPDKLRTLKFILGAIDDLFEFYNSFERMNLLPTEEGLRVASKQKAWFDINNNIHFKFRIRNRKFTIPWLVGVARSIFIIEKLKKHDWLRRRAGVIDPFKLKYKDIYKIFIRLLKNRNKFYEIKTPDFTMNSRLILKDLIATSIKNGLHISKGNKFLSYKKRDTFFEIHCDKENFYAEKIALCNGQNISNFLDASVKISYAPMAVVGNISKDTKSFVELDYFPQNCINIITKEKGIGLIGGISFNKREKCNEYIDEVFLQHKKYQPELKLLKKYIGVKSEITIKGEPRNYLFHIKEIQNNVWMVIPGKFTLGFSIGPEFYRRVYKKNPQKCFSTTIGNNDDNLIANTVWQDVLLNINKEKKNNGND